MKEALDTAEKEGMPPKQLRQFAGAGVGQPGR